MCVKIKMEPNDIVKHAIDLFFLHQDFKTLCSFFAYGMKWITTSGIDVGNQVNIAYEYFIKETLFESGKYHITEEAYDCEVISKDIAKVNCLVSLCSNEIKHIQKVRITVILKQIEDEWMIYHVHSSLCFDRDFFEFTPYLSDHHVMTVMIEQALKNNELTLYIQPQFDIYTKQVLSGEVLLRWQNESGNIIYPDRFLPVLEKEGSMQMIDFFVLERLCHTLATWRKEGKKDIQISINQSAIHFSNQYSEYLDDFIRIVDFYEIAHHNIVFELTESVLLYETEDVKQAFEILKNHGFQISLDDFGSGFASMNILNMIQPDELKIDKTLLADLTKEPKAKIIIKKIIEMAHELHMNVICEGIETENQLEFLQQAQCDKGQGYLVSKPIPIEEFACLYL